MGRCVPVRPTFHSALLACPLLLFASSTAADVSTGLEGRFHRRLAHVQVPFVANAGEKNPAVAFSGAILAGMAYVTSKGQIVYSLASEVKGSPARMLTETPLSFRSLRPVGKEPAETRVNYFLGEDPSRWRTGVETYRTVSLGEVWPGISLSVRAYGGRWS